MDEKQLHALKPELDMFIDRYAPLFGRAENHEHAGRFIHGLIGGQERRNIENIAEGVSGGIVRTMQKFISQGCWHAVKVLDEMRRHIVEILDDGEAIINVDETGFAKKGTKSVGVKRQYSGTLGRVDNCQVAVFANYCSGKGHTLFDRRLYLPKEWINDQERRREAGVPEGVVFRKKPELALEMIQEAVSNHTPFQWVGGDSVYGDSPTFVQGVRALGKWYVLDSWSNARVWLERPKQRKLGTRTSRGGRPRTRATATTKPITVAEAVASLPDSAFKRITVSDGSQGPIVYDYAELTVWFSEEGIPADESERLLVRRSLGQEPEVKYHRSNAPAAIPLKRLAQKRACRWTIEQDFQTGKGESGLDEYETRGWTGWHHHTALAMVALWFLALQSLRLEKKRAANDGARGAKHIKTPARFAPLGRPGNRSMEQLAHGTKPRGKTMPRRTTPSRKTAK